MSTWTIFFSSLDLCKKLAGKGTYMIGTMRVNRRGWPVELKKVQQLSKEMARGDTRSTVVDGIQCLLWKDNKGVSLINNIVDPNKRSTVLRCNKDGTRAQIPYPEAIRLYNRFMGGVDTFDTLRRAYSCSRKSNKWWMRIYYFLLDTTITNAYIIYNTTPHTKKLTHIEFVLAVAQHLISCHNSRKRPAVS